MTQVNLMTLIQMKVMKRNQMIQRLQKSQVSCMMKREEKIDIKQFYEAIRKRKKRTTKGDDEIPFKVVRGPRGHRGSKGRKGPPGDPVITQNLDRSVDANVTIDTAGLEKTFRQMGESMKEVFTSQQIFNRTMKDTLEASTKAQEKQTEALEKLNIST